MGDMPGIVASTKREIADLRMVAINKYSDTGQMCSKALSRIDAPDFKSVAEAVKWLDGKKIAVAQKGGCADKFFNSFVRKTGIKPESVQLLDPTIIKTTLEAKKVDAGFVFQPHAAQIINQGIGKIMFTGSTWASHDGSVIVMRKDFIDANPEAAKGWLKAEVEACSFHAEKPGSGRGDGRQGTAGLHSQGYLAIDVRTISDKHRFPGKQPHFTGGFRRRRRGLHERRFQFLHSIGSIPINKPLPGALYGELIDAALKEMNLKALLGVIKGLPLSEFKA